jgi:asparagine synthase (glutamine-hydrolysing)
MSRFLADCDLAGDGGFRASSAIAHDGCRVAWRGYLANAPELRADAGGRGGAPLASDGALLAFAYRRWGDELQRHVLGEYALALFDERRRRLLVTHDALGLVPCFYAVRGSRVVAGSHLDEVARAVAADGIDEDYVADLLALGRPSTGTTPYPGVRRLLPGRTLVCENGAARERTTWSLAGVAPLRLASGAEYEERCRALIAEGVRRALPEHGTAWCELSGGLDSSTVISVAASLGRALPALSSVYERSASADERPWMRAVLERYDLPWHPIDVDATPPFAELPGVPFAEPNATMVVPAYYRRHVETLERNGVEVVLTGAGGDHVFAGDCPEPRHLGDPLFRCDPAGFVRGLRDWQRRSPARRSLAHWLAHDVAGPAVRHAAGRSLLGDGSASYTLPAWYARDFARAKRLDARIRRRYAPRCRFPGDQYFAEALHVLGTIAGTHRDVLAERFEYRNPLLYRPLVEFMYAVPWDQRLEPDCQRSLQRRALRGILPEKVRRRRTKSGAQEAYFEGLRRGGPWLEILRGRPLIAARGYVEPAAWREAVEQARFGRVHTMRHFLTAATLECWLRERDHTTRTASTSSQGADHERPEILFQP